MNVCNPPVKVHVQLGRAVSVADQQWLLQCLEVLSIQLVVPLTEVLSQPLIQNMDCLFIADDDLFVTVGLRQKVGLLQHL